MRIDLLEQQALDSLLSKTVPITPMTPLVNMEEIREYPLRKELSLEQVATVNHSESVTNLDDPVEKSTTFPRRKRDKPRFPEPLPRGTLIKPQGRENAIATFLHEVDKIDLHDIPERELEVPKLADEQKPLQAFAPPATRNMTTSSMTSNTPPSIFPKPYRNPHDS